MCKIAVAPLVGAWIEIDKLDKDINGKHEESETVVEELILFIKPGLKERIGRDKETL